MKRTLDLEATLRLFQFHPSAGTAVRSVKANAARTRPLCLALRLGPRTGPAGTGHAFPLAEDGWTPLLVPALVLPAGASRAWPLPIASHLLLGTGAARGARRIPPMKYHGARVWSRRAH